MLLRLLILMMATGATIFPALAYEASEYELKAAYLYNFATFTTWPDQLESDFNLCIYGEDPFGPHLNQLKNESVDGHPIKIIHPQSLQAVGTCQLLYIAPSPPVAMDQILIQTRNLPILTVSDRPDGADQGVMINMNRDNNKITFEINLERIRRYNLNISAALLRFATHVIQ